MEKIKHILFPTDFSKNAEHAFVYALQLSKKMNTSIQVMHVVEPVYEPLDLPVIDEKTTKGKVAEAVISIKSFINHCIETAGIDKLVVNKLIQTNVEVGNPLITIERIVERDHIELVIMGSKGTNTVSEKIIGSVSVSVLAKVNCDIMIIPANAKIHDIRTIIFASDLKDTDPFQIWRAIKLLDNEDIKIRAVHVNKEKMHTISNQD